MQIPIQNVLAADQATFESIGVETETEIEKNTDNADDDSIEDSKTETEGIAAGETNTYESSTKTMYDTYVEVAMDDIFNKKKDDAGYEIDETVLVWIFVATLTAVFIAIEMYFFGEKRDIEDDEDDDVVDEDIDNE